MGPRQSEAASAVDGQPQDRQNGGGRSHFDMRQILQILIRR